MKYDVKISKENVVFKDAGKIRNAVFIEEQGFRNEFDEIDKTAYHAVMYDGSIPIACGRLYGDNGIYHVGRIAVIQKFRGQGLGFKIMSEIEKFAVEKLDAVKFVLSAQVRAKGFYETLGYSAEGEEYYDEYCPHVQMFKILAGN